MENKNWSEHRSDLQRQESERVKNNVNSSEYNRTSQDYYYRRNDRTAVQPKLAPNAVASLVLGILSILLFRLLFLGVILGFVGLYKANKGLREYKEQPGLYKGYGMLIAGKILSLISIIIFGIVILIMLLAFLGVVAFTSMPF
ncbi:MAG: DUF4190 domain-containing protein [Bacteroidales bacterium]|nr:DUF4190 domain-containing protein [Bacteroidales bacterium]